VRDKYLDAFTSDDVTPLVTTLLADVYANRFRTDRHTVWTLYNAGEQAVDGLVLRIEHVEGAKYLDAWNHAELTPVIQAGWALLTLQLDAKDVGCVVRSR